MLTRLVHVSARLISSRSIVSCQCQAPDRASGGMTYSVIVFRGPWGISPDVLVHIARHGLTLRAAAVKRC